MERYTDWSPTPFDPCGLALDNRQDWLVAPVSRTRDSGHLSESNFTATERELTKADPSGEDFEVHRFGHWGPGWFEIILVRPDSACAAVAEDIERALADYPILDDEDFSWREYEAAHDYWDTLTIAERIDLCRDYGASIFAARHGEIPSECFQRIVDSLQLD